MNPIHIELRHSLKDAFDLAKEKLRGDEWNRRITEEVANDSPNRNVRWERSLDNLFEEALSEQFSSCHVCPQWQRSNRRNSTRIDLCVVCDGQVTVAIECKGMVANSVAGESNRMTSLSVHGITNKLDDVEKDIRGIRRKLGRHWSKSHFEVFVPVIYELYRPGSGNEPAKRDVKPWITLPRYRDVRDNLSADLDGWFQKWSVRDTAFEIIHQTEPIELRDANQLWRERGYKHYPRFRSLEAYVSFFAFGRFVEGRRR